MPAPVEHILFAPARQMREIDEHYHLQMVAANTDQLIQHQQRAFRLQRKAAAENLRSLASLGTRQDRTNALIEELNGRAQELLLATNAQTDVLREGFEELAEGLGQLNATAEDLLDATNFQTEVLQKGFATVAQLMMEQHRTLLEITRVLRNPYETKAQELLKETERALKNGMQASGRDRQEEFKDALRLLTEVLNNPIGSRDFVAWFQIGWLKWKDKQNLPAAAEAFYQAARLSGTERKPHYVSSLRHLAYIQYLQGQHQDAFTTIEKAVQAASEDHDVLLRRSEVRRQNAAESVCTRAPGKMHRLASANHRHDVQRTGFPLMTASMKQDLLTLLTRRTQQARENANRELRELVRSVQIVNQAAKMAQCDVQLPTDVSGNLAKRINRLRWLAYVLAVQESAQAREQRKTVLSKAEQRLTQEIQYREEASGTLQAQIDDLRAELAQKKRALVDRSKKEKDSEHSKAEKRKGSCVDGILHAIGTGCGVGVALWVLIGWPGCIVMNIAGTRESTKETFLWSLFLIPTAIGMLVALCMSLWVWCANFDRDRNLHAIAEEVSWDLRDLDRELPAKLAPLEKAISSARGWEKKARTALDWLQEQQGRTKRGS